MIKKKILNIGIITLFIGACIFPIISASNVNDVKTSHYKDSIHSYNIFCIVYGRIKYLEEESDCYVVTPINVRAIYIYMEPNMLPVITTEKIIDDPTYILKDVWHGFIGKNYLFMWHYGELI